MGLCSKHFFLLLLALGFTGFARSEPIELNEDDVIIVEFRLSKTILNDAMIAYHSDTNTFISLEEFVDALDFAVEVVSDEAKATGWYANQDNSFELNIPKNELYLRGERQELGPDFKYGVDEWGLYLEIEDLREWFNLDITINMARLQIQVESEEPLPIEQKKLRERNRSKQKSQRGSRKRYPVIHDHYAWVGPASIDLSLNTTTDNSNGQLYGYALQTAGDVLKHETRLSHTRSDQLTPTNTRLSFTRKAKKPGEDIFLGIHEYNIGDIYHQGDSLVKSGGSGVGFKVERRTSASLDRSFNRRDFEGDAPPGWEAELYRNDIYIDFQEIDESGQYIFQDIALQYGENIFEIRLYGPQGQERVIKERISIGNGLITPGEFQFSMAGLTENDLLIGEPTSLGNNARQNQYLNMSAYYGIVDQHSIGIGFDKASSSVTQAERHYARITWLPSFSRMSARIDYARDLDLDDEAVNIELTGRFSKQDFSLEHKEFNGFKSQQSVSGSTLSETELTLFGSIKGAYSRTFPYTLGVSQLKRKNGDSILGVNNTLSYSWRRFRLSNQLDFSSSDMLQNDIITSDISLDYRTLGRNIRTALRYDIGNNEPSSYSITADLKNQKMNYRFSADGTFDDESTHTAGINISRKFDTYSLSLNGTFHNDGDFLIGFAFEMGLQTKKSQPFLSQTQFGNLGSGSAKLRVFLDNDSDGKFSEGDEPMQGVKFTGRPAWLDLETNDQGELFLRGLDSKNGTVVHVDALSLDDPYLLPMKKSFRVISHAGAHRIIDVPVVQTTEIEGYVFVRRGDKKIGAGGVPIGLYRNGELIRAVTTEFDGYFLMSQAIPGIYTVDLLDDKGVMTQYQWHPPEPFETDTEMGIMVVDDIVLVKQEPKESEAEK